MQGLDTIAPLFLPTVKYETSCRNRDIEPWVLSVYLHIYAWLDKFKVVLSENLLFLAVTVLLVLF